MSLPTHAHDLAAFSHSHAFADAGMDRRRQALTIVTLLTLVTMVAELLAGWWRHATVEVHRCPGCPGASPV